VLVDAEDFVRDQNGGEWSARGGHRAIGGNLATLHRNLHFARHEAVRIGRDGFGRDREYGERESGGKGGRHELAARELA